MVIIAIQRQNLIFAPSFSIHNGNTIFLVATHPVCHFLSFQHFQSALLHQGRLLGKIIIEKEPDLMEKSLRRIEITNGVQDLGGTFHTRTSLLFLKNPVRTDEQTGSNFLNFISSKVKIQISRDETNDYI
jgi:hypothetical protein